MKYLINVFIIAIASALSLVMHADVAHVGNSNNVSHAQNLTTQAITCQSLADIKLQSIVEAQNALLSKLESNPSAFSEMEKERRFNDIFNDYEDFIAKNPNNIYAAIFYGKLLRLTGLSGKAYTVFLTAHKANPNIGVIKQQIGNCLAEEGEFALALNYFLQAITLEPSVALYHYQLGELLRLFKNSFITLGILSTDSFDKQMLNAFRKAKELEPRTWVYQVRYAEAFYDIHKPLWDEALLLWKNLALLAPNTWEKEIVSLNQARVQIKRKHYSQAKECLANVYSPALEKSRRELYELIPNPF